MYNPTKGRPNKLNGSRTKRSNHRERRNGKIIEPEMNLGEY